MAGDHSSSDVKNEVPNGIEKKEEANTMYAGRTVEYEFGGPNGALALMIWSHCNLVYFWYCLETNNGCPIIPTSIEALKELVTGELNLLATKAIPSTTTWIAYFFFFFIQLVFAAILPGTTMYGLPTAPHGKRLPYHCNGYACYYLCLFGLFLMHWLGVFPLTYLWDHFGECLVASMIIGDVTSLIWYLYGLYLADEYNGKASWTGNAVYDFFMGTILYPRIGEVDIKMVAEVRWSWITLMMITLSCAAKQYETKGYITGNMWFMILAHWLYSNACVKGEHCIPCTWDMFHENFGWMLNFWNISGVPFLYCYQSLYVLKNQDLLEATYPKPLLIFNFCLLLVAYYMWDTSNSQKANIKVKVKRNTFPQLPWGEIEEPIRVIETPHGRLLVDGWYAFARKLQYSGDILMALSWGLACGFGSYLPFFYVSFFTFFVYHRQIRDEARCSAKYGKYWEEYVRKVPNVFVPSSSFFVWLFTGKHPDGPKVKKAVVEDKKAN